MTGLLTLVDDGVAQHALLPNGEYTCAVQHPRTLLGLSRDKKKLFLVVVDGRAPAAGRRGMTCGEAADFMVSLGAWWGSTSTAAAPRRWWWAGASSTCRRTGASGRCRRTSRW
jgi:hypothetical protein